MKEFYIMHDSRGQVQTVPVGGSMHVAVWPDMLTALRYKTRHPELMDYWIVPIDRLLYEEKFLERDGGQQKFFLMSGANPGLEILCGRVLDTCEIESSIYPEIFGERAPVTQHPMINAPAPSSSLTAL